MSNDICLITGATSGVGLALATRLISRYSIVGVSRRPPTNSRWISLPSDRCHHVIGDVADPKTVAVAFDTCSEHGQLRVLINCAGAGVFGAAGSYSAEDVTEALRGNLIGTILFADRAFAAFKESFSSGIIINVMSTAAQVGRANETVYCASKWGARGYTEALRLEAKGTGIRVIGVYPGGMNTPFWRNARNSSVDSSKFMNPDDVAAMIVAALPDNLAAYVSDLVINRS